LWILTLALCFSVIFIVNGATLTVHPSGTSVGAAYSTLADAYGAATAGDVIQILATTGGSGITTLQGANNKNLNITKAVTFAGVAGSPSSVVIDCQSSGTIFITYKYSILQCRILIG
jgi:NADPH-dependent curcumin reductase CurA